MAENYSTVTEVPGLKASRGQLSMLYTRYRYAAQFCEGKEVLEVACGAGMGLGYLAKKARTVIGGDHTPSLLRRARQHYRNRVPLLRLDAHVLPFRASSFDVAILHEAIYYLEEPGRFLDECRRVLREEGVLLICTVNREWPDFNPSPFSVRYFSAEELRVLLEEHRFHVQLYGAFPVSQGSWKSRVISRLKRLAVSLNLIPKTMKGKEILKRLFLGPLAPVPPEIHDGLAPWCPPAPIARSSRALDFKVLFASARR